MAEAVIGFRERLKVRRDIMTETIASAGAGMMPVCGAPHSR